MWLDDGRGLGVVGEREEFGVFGCFEGFGVVGG